MMNEKGVYILDVLLSTTRSIYIGTPFFFFSHSVSFSRLFSFPLAARLVWLLSPHYIHTHIYIHRDGDGLQKRSGWVGPDRMGSASVCT